MSSGIPASDATERVETPAPGRECGTCSLCCKVYRIEVLAKPAGEMCRHCLPGKGCGIWETRPQYCRAFYCLWMAESWLGPEWKPENCHFVMAFHPSDGCINVRVDTDHPDVWRAEPFHDQFRRWSELLLPDFRMVLVYVGASVTAITPKGDVELGVLGPEDSIGLQMSMTPDGPAYDVYRKQGSAA
jgi:hypothetical protein